MIIALDIHGNRNFSVKFFSLFSFGLKEQEFKADLLARVETDGEVLEYAGAFNPLYIFNNKEFREIKANMFPVGLFIDENNRKFTNHKLKIKTSPVQAILPNLLQNKCRVPMSSPGHC